ncbi:hypothetical protein COL940_014178 [Colletotrichum noveboracense]|nr:hypothetical protein COL940_014178 [Colletotrichum noveboracense]KAJ0289191.1 hypothetical protein CBS470a_004550 [Colletotrichum nupharicola]
MNFVADGSKLRRARNIIMRDFDSSQRKHARNLETKSSRQRCVQTLAKYHDEIDKLVGGRNVWLPAGVAVESITYENILNIRKIVNFTLAKTPDCDPASLWSPENGALFGVRYTGKGLSKLWASMSQELARPGQPATRPVVQEEGRTNSPSPPPDALIHDDSEDADRLGNSDVFPIDTNSESEWEDTDQEGEPDIQLDNAPQEEVDLPTRRSHLSSSSPEASRRARQHVNEVKNEPVLAHAKCPATPEPLWSPIPLPVDDTLHVATPPLLKLASFEPGTASPALPSRILRLKRSRSDEKSETTTKKRRFTPKARNEADLPTQPRAEFSIDSIAPGRYVSDAFMFHVLNMIVALCPLSVQLVDSLLTKPDRPTLPSRLRHTLTSRRDSIILAPINLTRISRHWVLAVAAGNNVSIFDSLPGATDEAELKARLQGVVKCLHARQPPSDGDVAVSITYSHEACAVQEDGVSCGVAVMANALYVVAGVEMPIDVPDYAVWRRVLAAFATGDGIMSGGFGPATSGTEGQVLPASSISTPPSPPVGDLTRSEFSAWRRKTAAYEASVKTALRQAHRQFTDAKDTLSAAAALWADVSKVGTGSWSPRLRKTRQSTDFLDEIQADYGRYSSAAKILGSCVDADEETVQKLENKMKELRQLQDGRTAVLNRVAALSQALHEENIAIGRQAEDSGWIWEDGTVEQN